MPSSFIPEVVRMHGQSGMRTQASEPPEEKKRIFRGIACLP